MGIIPILLLSGNVMEEIHSLNVKEVSTLEVARTHNAGVAEWMGPSCLAVSGCSYAHNRSQWVKNVMENGVKGVEGLHGEADGTHAEYTPQRCVGMLGGETKVHPSLLP